MGFREWVGLTWCQHCYIPRNASNKNRLKRGMVVCWGFIHMTVYGKGLIKIKFCRKRAVGVGGSIHSNLEVIFDLCEYLYIIWLTLNRKTWLWSMYILICVQMDGNGFCIVWVCQRERECVSVWKVSFYQLFIFLKPFIKHSNDMYQFITVCLYCFCLLNPGVFQVFHYSQVFVSLCIWIIQTSTRVHATHACMHAHTHTMLIMEGLGMSSGTWL